MRKPEQAPEPSIEEILASIRRIIADDAPPATAVEEAMPGLSRAPWLRSAESGQRGGEGRNEDEVLELTEDFMLAEESTSAAHGQHDDAFGPSGDDSDRDPFADPSSVDPYDDGAGVPQYYAGPRASTPPAAAPQSQATTSSLASVMAEVQRFVDVGKAAEVASKPSPKPLDGWTQPSHDVFKSDPAPRAPSRWSARAKVADTAKGPEPLPAARSEPATLARDQAALRRQTAEMRDSWSQGVQMPVPDEGPAMPFGADDSTELRPASNPAASPLGKTVQESLPPSEALTSQEKPSATEQVIAPAAVFTEAEMPVPNTVQTRAEKLAQQAVSDFASDTFSAPPVADFLKSDKPLMQAITGTLAQALSKVGEPSREYDSPPTIEESPEDSSVPEWTSQAPIEEQSAPASPVANEMLGSPDGMTAFQPAPPAQHPASAAALPDQEASELPREDIDDTVAAPHRGRMEPPLPFQSTGTAEQPAMPQVPVAPARMPSRPAASASVVRGPEIDRLQPSAAMPRSLEETVRDMLRPMLAQWLNENMPRIINDAIREEMAAAGLLRSRMDSERR
jgi:cell pole-organizing protein PopZ